MAHNSGRPVKQSRASCSHPGIRLAVLRAAQQRFAGGSGIGDAGKGNLCAALAHRAFGDRAFGVDHHEAAGGIDRRGSAEFQGEIQRLAQQDDQVGAFRHVGEGAERRVVEAARAFDDAGRHLQRCFQLRQQLASAAVGQLRPGDQQRPSGACQDRQHRVCCRIVQRHWFGGECAGVGPADRIAGDACIQQIGWQAEMHRPGPSGFGDAQRLRDILAQAFRIGGGPRRFADRRGHFRLAQFLETAAAELVGFGVAGQQHQRQFLAKRGEQRGDRVGVAGTAGDHGDAGLAGQPAVRVGHVHRGGFVPRVHQVEPCVQCGIEQRHDVVAGQREDALIAGVFQRAHDDVGAAKGLGHAEVSRVLIVGVRTAGSGPTGIMDGGL